ncbi:MAG: hypothetical protein UDG86_03555 [Lachnospiraceae bacterium]|jgi:hypothetical protein|nr:hypothetical protein [Lachnospiraceae bacterium]
MSEFSTRCQQLIEANNTSVYRISKQTNLERTALHRMTIGRQIPPQDFFDKFCDFLRISPNERLELRELYLEEKIGREKYQNRKYILELIEHLAEMEEVSLASTYYQENQDLFLSSDNRPMISYSQNPFQTHMLLTSVLGIAFRSEKRQSIITNIPSSFSLFMQDLRYFFQCYQKDVEIQHLLTFHSNPHGYKNVNCNLEILHEILPLALSPFQNYMPYYTYSQYLPADIDYLPMPYYLVTNDYVLALSSDMKAAILHDNPNIVQKYKEQLKLLLQNAKSLVHCTKTAPESLHFYRTASLNSGWISYSLESYPCITPLMPEERFAKYMKQTIQACYSDSSIVTSTVSTLLDQIKCSLSHSPQVLFTLPGFMLFCQTGKVTGQIACYFPAFTIDERKKMLNKILALNNNASLNNYGSIRWHLCREDFKIPTHIHLDMFDQRTLMFSKFCSGFDFRFAFLDESSIFEAFSDFFSSLEESRLIYSTEETNAIVRDYLSEL